MTCGIYKIENNINHQIYIGQSCNIENRWRKYRTSNDNYSINLAIKKYGIENFTFSVVEECNIEDLDEREIYWIKQYDSYYNGYNETKGGRGTPGVSVKLSNDQVKQIQNLLATTKRTNIDIANEFSVSENIICGINTGYYWREDSISYPIRIQPTRSDRFCPLCGKKLKSDKAKHCSDCAAILKRKVERPTKERLFQQLQDAHGSFTKIGKLYGVSDNTIRKWCVSYDIPSHSADYKTQVIKKGKNFPPIRVQQIDKKTGIVIKEYESLTQAEKETGIDHIIEASDPNNSNRKSAGGYIWKRI